MYSKDRCSSDRQTGYSGDKNSEMFVTERLLSEMLDETVTGTKEVPVRIDEGGKIWYWNEEANMEFWFSFDAAIRPQEFVPAVADETIANAIECHLAWYPAWMKGKREGVSFLKTGKVRIFPGDQVLVLTHTGRVPVMGGTRDGSTLTPILLRVLGPIPQVRYHGRG